MLCSSDVLVAYSRERQYADGLFTLGQGLAKHVYFELGEVLSVLVFGAVCLYFLGAIRVREIAVQAVARASERDDFQLLDQSVHIQRISLSRGATGRWQVWRQYRFDYSFDGVERRQGHVIMLGRTLQALVTSERSTTLH